jgi:putative transposase
MSPKASTPDNAACEGPFGGLKMEMFYPRDRRSTMIAQSVGTLDGNIRWCNEMRIKNSLGYLRPIKYRESLGLTT